MPLLHLIVLAAVQGVTEFLPISSSGHLVLVPALTGWPDQQLLVDVAVHVGTLLAVVLYFWRDVGQVLVGFYRILRGRRDHATRLVWLLIIGTVPVVVAGGLLVFFDLTQYLRSPLIIAWTTLGFGLVLLVSDRLFLTVRKLTQMTPGHAAFVGVAQILSLVPGTSRSGITMTAARILGFEREDAARYSMLLSIPTIIAAAALVILDALESGAEGGLGDAVFAGVLAFGFALVSIAALLAWLRRATFTPFAIYRLVLGGGLLVWIYWFGGGALG
jgi:undecaprenyl-diphosphatase